MVSISITIEPNIFHEYVYYLLISFSFYDFRNNKNQYMRRHLRQLVKILQIQISINRVIYHLFRETPKIVE